MPLARRVLVVTPSTDTRAGGFERFSNLLAEALSAQFSVELVASSRASSSGRVPHALSWLRDSRTTGARIAPSGQDLIISGVTIGSGFPEGVPRIHVCHGTMPHNAIAASGEPLKARLSALIGGGLAEAAAARGAKIVAVSHATAKEFRRLYGYRREVAVIENGVDLSVFYPRDRGQSRTILGLDQGKRYALFVGRPEMRKGIDIAVEACARSGYELLLAGSRPFAGATWLGLLDEDRLASAYSAADCVLFPTRYEACSYTVLEALACGAVLLTTRTGWMKGVAQSDRTLSGYLLDPDANHFAQALRLLGAREAWHQKVSASLRDLVMRENNLTLFSNRWVSMCERVLDGAPGTN